MKTGIKNEKTHTYTARIPFNMILEPTHSVFVASRYIELLPVSPLPFSLLHSPLCLLRVALCLLRLASIAFVLEGFNPPFSLMRASLGLVCADATTLAREFCLNNPTLPGAVYAT